MWCVQNQSDGPTELHVNQDGVFMRVKKVRHELVLISSILAADILRYLVSKQLVAKYTTSYWRKGFGSATY